MLRKYGFTYPIPRQGVPHPAEAFVLCPAVLQPLPFRDGHGSFLTVFIAPLTRPAHPNPAAGLVHVHHVVPISNIGKEYQLNVNTDLVPVCPNYHYMLHRKDPPYTVEEMKKTMLPQPPTVN